MLKKYKLLKILQEENTKNTQGIKIQINKGSETAESWSQSDTRE